MISIVFHDAARIYRTVICVTYNSAIEPGKLLEIMENYYPGKLLK